MKLFITKGCDYKKKMILLKCFEQIMLYNSLSSSGTPQVNNLWLLKNGILNLVSNISATILALFYLVINVAQLISRTKNYAIVID